MDELAKGESEIESAEQLFAKIRNDFGETSEEERKIEQLRTIEQGGRTCNKYVQEFKKVARGSGYEGRSYGGRGGQIMWRTGGGYRGGGGENMSNRGGAQMGPRRDPNAMEVNRGREGDRTCYVCGKWGHMAKNCWERHRGRVVETLQESAKENGGQ